MNPDVSSQSAGQTDARGADGNDARFTLSADFEFAIVDHAHGGQKLEIGSFESGGVQGDSLAYGRLGEGAALPVFEKLFHSITFGFGFRRAKVLSAVEMAQRKFLASPHGRRE